MLNFSYRTPRASSDLLERAGLNPALPYHANNFALLVERLIALEARVAELERERAKPAGRRRVEDIVEL